MSDSQSQFEQPGEMRTGKPREAPLGPSAETLFPSAAGASRDEVLARKGNYFDGVESGVFPELGQGTVDWAGIAAILEEIDYQGWGTVEQDILPDSGIDALACARRNRAFLRDTLGW